MRGQLAALNDALPGPGLAADHQPQERRDQAHTAGPAARAAEPAAAEESRPRPVGAGPADRHGHRSRAADRDARPAHGRRARARRSPERCCGSGCCCSPTRTARTPGSAPSPPASTATARPTCATPPAGTSRSTALAPSRSSSPTRRSPPAKATSGGRARPPSRQTPRTSARMTRTCSPNGTRATAAVAC